MGEEVFQVENAFGGYAALDWRCLSDQHGRGRHRRAHRGDARDPVPGNTRGTLACLAQASANGVLVQLHACRGALQTGSAAQCTHAHAHAHARLTVSRHTPAGALQVLQGIADKFADDGGLVETMRHSVDAAQAELGRSLRDKLQAGSSLTPAEIVPPIERHFADLTNTCQVRLF